MKKLHCLVVASVVTMLAFGGCKPQDSSQVVIKDCTDEIAEGQVERVIEEMLVPIPIASANGSWKIVENKYEISDEKFTEDSCQSPDCRIRKATCKVVVDLTNTKSRKFEMTEDTASYDPINKEVAEEDKEKLPEPSVELDNNKITITKRFIHEDTCKESDELSPGYQNCEIWETIVETEFTQTEYALCDAESKVDENPFGSGTDQASPWLPPTPP